MTCQATSILFGSLLILLLMPSDAKTAPTKSLSSDTRPAKNNPPTSVSSAKSSSQPFDGRLSGTPKPSEHQIQVDSEMLEMHMETRRRTQQEDAMMCVPTCSHSIRPEDEPDETFLDAYRRLGMEPFKQALYAQDAANAA